MNNSIVAPEHQFLSNAGEMGALIYAKDWSATALGPISEWPQSLITTLGIILHSKFPMFLFWGDELTCFYNDAFRPSLGINGKHPVILGSPGSEAWAEIWPIIKPLIDVVVTRGEAVWFEDQLVPFFRNGRMEDIYWTFSYSPVTGESGKTEGVFVTCNETTQNVYNTRKLWEHERFYKSLLEEAPVATTFFKGSDFVIELANAETLKLWGRTEEVIGKPLLEALPETEEQPFIAYLKKVYQTGGSYYGKEQLAHLHHQGKIKTYYLNFIYKAILDDSGEVQGVLSMTNDVTEQVINRKKIKESEERLAMAIEAATLGTFDFDIAQHTFITSKRLQEIFGFEKEYISQEKFIAAIHSQDSHLIKDGIQLALNTGSIDEEVRIIKPNSSIHWINIKGRLLFDIEGKPARVLGTVRDITHEKSLFEKIESSEKKFRDTVMQAPVGILILKGPSLIVEMANKAYLELVDKTEADFIGKPLFERLPEVRQAVEPLMRDVMATGIPYEGVEFPVTLNRYGKQEITYFNFVYQPLYEDDTFINGVIVVANEVTRQVAAKHAVEESERQVRDMVTQSPVAMAIFRGRDFVIEVANKTLLKNLWRRELNEVAGKKLLDVFPELTGQPFPGLLNKVFDTGISHKESEAIAYVDAEDGRKHFYLDFEYAPLFEKDGSVSGIMITVNNVTEKVEARLLLKDTAERLQLAVEGSRLATWDMNLQTGEIFHTERLTEIFGLERTKHLTHVALRAQLHPSDRVNVVEKAFNLAMETGDYFYEARIFRPDKSQHWIRTQGKVIFDENHRPLRMLGTLMDITAQKYAEQQKDDFIKMASHELKTPVTSIKGYVQLLQKMNEHGEEFLTRSLSVIDKQIAKLTKLISDLLDVTRIETGGLQLNKEYFSLQELAAEVVRDIQATTDTHNVKIISENNIAVFADRDRISQVLVNLLTNAIKYSPGANSIEVDIQTSSNTAILSVHDSGIGIATEEQDKIFERFYRAGGAHEKTFPGFGIGLFIVNEIVTQHNGKIWVESDKGKGSAFYVSLPING